ncbi:hypothetical protein CYMTET_34551 [Cymbomonas tetramitiformis]|uniref:Virilizer N-terminal domain-containing protein n=1 Tax=Cymbomonas tetramitiformis TaxID=36881 RepID=A0AAE0KPR5_9CHLO|nr:hypothetical protein CYMTET_34551 [Cymbomonas tetramitiformis]
MGVNPHLPTDMGTSESSSTTLKILFCDTFTHSKAGEKVDEIRFERPVVILDCRILPKDCSPSPSLLPDFKGETRPENFEIQAFARNIRHKSDRFQRLCPPFAYSEEASSSMDVEAVVTDHVVLRGTYEALSLVIFGTTAPVLEAGQALSLKNRAVWDRPPSLEVLVDQSRTLAATERERLRFEASRKAAEPTAPAPEPPPPAAGSQQREQQQWEVRETRRMRVRSDAVPFLQEESRDHRISSRGHLRLEYVADESNPDVFFLNITGSRRRIMNAQALVQKSVMHFMRGDVEDGEGSAKRKQPDSSSDPVATDPPDPTNFAQLAKSYLKETRY